MERKSRNTSQPTDHERRVGEAIARLVMADPQRQAEICAALESLLTR
jgi:hypothetical protein